MNVDLSSPPFCTVDGRNAEYIDAIPGTDLHAWKVDKEPCKFDDPRDPGWQIDIRCRSGRVWDYLSKPHPNDIVNL